MSAPTLLDSTSTSAPLLDRVDLLRIDASSRLDPARQAELGQYFTPPPVARLMASLFHWPDGGHVRLLDAGAGVGSLTAAAVDAMLESTTRPKRLDLVAYEVDSLAAEYLTETLRACTEVAKAFGIEVTAELRRRDFIDDAAQILRGGLFASGPAEEFNCAILNPPYRKIHSRSQERATLRDLGIETSNLYTGFLALVIRLLEQQGQLVAITPRSFCNGPYFKPFRKLLLDAMAIQNMHVFEKRDCAFADSAVLQENVILHAVKGGVRGAVVVSTSEGDGPHDTQVYGAQYDDLVRPGDPEMFICLTADGLQARIADRMAQLPATLADLGISVSTGRVVDFRAKEHLRQKPGARTAPLIYPAHFENGFITWPLETSRKPNAIVDSEATLDLMIPGGTYVLVKRFSAKEEPRRVVAVVLDPAHVDADRIGLENHLNYFHANGRGLERDVALGLSGFLNSTLLDAYFRQFSGHTQVNATDLRNIRYPSTAQLKALGARLADGFPDQDKLDDIVEEELFSMAAKGTNIDPVRAKKRIAEALALLTQLGLPREQLNERSALTLLALLNLKPKDSWKKATNPLRGITEMMEFFAEHYGKTYAPNTRETVRRFTVHQFVQAGLAIQNPDDPKRPTNSPNNVYQVPDAVLALLRDHRSRGWKERLAAHLGSGMSLAKKYAVERELPQIEVTLPKGRRIDLTPGDHNELIKQVIDEFCPRFTPGAKVVYVGDTGKKWAFFDDAALASLGVRVDSHGKMPDVVVHYESRGWLVLIEAVTSHGPMSPKRHVELKELFADSTAGLVFVTAFLERRDLTKYLRDIAWETEVWVADAPSHLIHFNGERFLGPYGDKAPRR